MPSIGDYVLDSGLAVLDDGTLAFHICTAEPASYANVAAVTLGNKAAPPVTTLSDASPNGRKGTIGTFTGGAVTSNGTAAAWALVDSATSRLLASGATTSQVVASGNSFSLSAAIDIRIPDAAANFINDRVLDFGLANLISEGVRIDLCPSEPASFAAISGITLANGTVSYGSITAASPNGRQVSGSAAGSNTGTGTSNFWAISNIPNSRLLATGPILPPAALTSGQSFSIPVMLVAKLPGAVSGAAASATSHDLVFEVNSATLDIGAHDASRRVWATVMIGGSQASGFVTSGGPTASLVENWLSYPSRGLELFEISGATGSTVASTWTGNTAHVATFRTIGLQPKSSGSIVAARQAGLNNTQSAVAVSVPIGGALFVHGKRYNSFTTNGPTITVDEAFSADPGMCCRGAWFNNTGSMQSFNVTFTTSLTMTEKYGMCVIMEPIP